MISQIVYLCYLYLHTKHCAVVGIVAMLVHNAYMDADAYTDQNSVWFYTGIRSVGKYVAVLDQDKHIRELYQVNRNRRYIRQWLREEFGDSIVIVPLAVPKKDLTKSQQAA